MQDTRRLPPGSFLGCFAYPRWCQNFCNNKQIMQGKLVQISGPGNPSILFTTHQQPRFVAKRLLKKTSLSRLDNSWQVVAFKHFTFSGISVVLNRFQFLEVLSRQLVLLGALDYDAQILWRGSGILCVDVRDLVSATGQFLSLRSCHKDFQRFVDASWDALLPAMPNTEMTHKYMKPAQVKLLIMRFLPGTVISVQIAGLLWCGFWESSFIFISNFIGIWKWRIFFLGELNL